MPAYYFERPISWYYNTCTVRNKQHCLMSQWRTCSSINGVCVERYWDIRAYALCQMACSGCLSECVIPCVSLHEGTRRDRVSRCVCSRGVCSKSVLQSGERLNECSDGTGCVRVRRRSEGIKWGLWRCLVQWGLMGVKGPFRRGNEANEFTL